MGGYCLVLAACTLISIPIALSFLGWIHKVNGYNYFRGRQDGRGMGTVKDKNERAYRISFIIAWIFLPIGLWYLLGWYLAGKRGYDLGKRVGESDRFLIDKRTGDLFDKQYYEID